LTEIFAIFFLKKEKKVDEEKKDSST